MQGGDVNQAQSEGFKIGTFVRAYMTHGHLQADLDPLELNKAYDDLSQSKFRGPSEIMRDILTVENYNFTEQDLDRTFHIQVPSNYNWGGLLSAKTDWTLRELREALQKAYCGKIGVEYMHIPNRDECNWIRAEIETK